MKSKITKNKFLRIASFVVVLCLLTTCAISTTFAKYATQDSAADTARVAKWGIEVSTSGTLFGKDYAANDAADDGDSIIASTSQSVSANENVVAPGTKNETGFKVSVTGKPEVAYKVIANAEDVKDIYLINGEYGMMVEVYGLNLATDIANYYVKDDNGVYTKATTYNPSTKYYQLNDKATVAYNVGSGASVERYTPIKWTINNFLTIGSGLENVAPIIAEQLNCEKNANEEINISSTLTWAWSFDGNDDADTILGNLIAQKDNMVVKNGDQYTTLKYDGDTAEYNNGTEDITVANLKVVFNFKVRVEQVD